MDIWGDLKHAKWMYLKAVLFLLAGTVAAVALFMQTPDLRTAFLIAVLVWAFCRLYYFLFYVIERYIDPAYRFDGVLSAIVYLIRRRKGATDSSGSAVESEKVS